MGEDGTSSDEELSDVDDPVIRTLGWRGDDANTAVDIVDALTRRRREGTRGKPPRMRIRDAAVSRESRRDHIPKGLPANFYGPTVDTTRLQPKEALNVNNIAGKATLAYKFCSPY